MGIKLCDVIEGNFLSMPFEDNHFDAAYAIEATCHSPTVRLSKYCKYLVSYHFGCGVNASHHIACGHFYVSTILSIILNLVNGN